MKPKFGMVCPLAIFGVQIESMDILFIGKGDGSVPDLEKAVRAMGHRVHRPDGTTGSGSWDTVILDPAADLGDPALALAKEQGLAIQSLAEFLYVLSREKTRVVIGGQLGRDRILAMIMHVLRYNSVEVDHYMGDGVEMPGPRISLGETNDFMVIQGDERPASVLDPRPQFHLYRPNIALLCGMDPLSGSGPTENGGAKESYRIFVESIVKGGSITFNEEDAPLGELVNGSGNPIRKFPYATPVHKTVGNTVLLDTPEGELPLQGFGAADLLDMEGAKWICQQLGVDPAEFYEAMTIYSH